MSNVIRDAIAASLAQSFNPQDEEIKEIMAKKAKEIDIASSLKVTEAIATVDDRLAAALERKAPASVIQAYEAQLVKLNSLV